MEELKQTPATGLVMRSQVFSKTPVVILTLEEYNALISKAKENNKLKQIIETLNKLKSTIGDADNLCNKIITEM